MLNYLLDKSSCFFMTMFICGIAIIFYNIFFKRKIRNTSWLQIIKANILKRNSAVVILFIVSMLVSGMITGCCEFSECIDQAAINTDAIKNMGNKNMQHAGNTEDSRFRSVSFEAKNICVLNADKSSELYSLNCDERIAPASTAKMLTALTVLQFCDVNEKVIVGDEINEVSSDASKAGLIKGNKLTIKQLLEGLLLPSGNDAAYTLAAYTGRKIARNTNLKGNDAVKKFVEKMNENAVKTGACNSKFLTPDGYDKDGQFSTAHDLACIASAFMKSDYSDGILRKIVKQQRIRECFLDGRDVTWNNTNELLDPQSKYYLKNAAGLKTGSSGKAGKCLISAVYIKNKLYIAVVMGDTEEGRYMDTSKIFNILQA